MKTDSADYAIVARDVRLEVPGQRDPILENISLTVREGEFVALVGPSGSGKTTFLNMVAGLRKMTSGELLVRGRVPRAGRRDTSYALARDALLPWRNALDNVALALQVRGVPKAERHRRAREVLARVGLEDAEDRHRSQLSQGMRQRVALARTLIANPSLLILDEPFAALDAQTRMLMQELLLNLLREFSGTMLFVTHDIGEAITLADRVVVFTRRPAKIRASYSINIPRPRHPAELRVMPVFLKLFESVWGEIVAEMEGHKT